MAEPADASRRDLAAAALARGASVAAAARASGYDRCALYRVLRDPAFKRLLEQARARAATVEDSPESAGGAGDPADPTGLPSAPPAQGPTPERLQSAGWAGVVTLVEVARSPKAEDTARVAAAKELVRLLRVPAVAVPGPSVARPAAKILRLSELDPARARALQDQAARELAI